MNWTFQFPIKMFAVIEFPVFRQENIFTSLFGLTSNPDI